MLLMQLKSAALSLTLTVFYGDRDGGELGVLFGDEAEDKPRLR